MMYNYLESMVMDVIEAIKENHSNEEIIEALADNRDSFEEDLHDSLWIDDSVTGNASGSYYCNFYKAREAVLDNMDLCREALHKFCVEADTIAEKFLDEDWEYLDVTIRCYLLGQAISEALDSLEEENSEAIEAYNAQFEEV